MVKLWSCLRRMTRALSAQGLAVLLLFQALAVVAAPESGAVLASAGELCRPMMSVDGHGRSQTDERRHCAVCPPGCAEHAANLAVVLAKAIHLFAPRAAPALGRSFAAEAAATPPGRNGAWSSRAPPLA